MLPQKDLVIVFVTTQQRGLNDEQDHVAPCSMQSAIFLTGCLFDDDDDEIAQPEPEFANVRVIHGSCDAPLVSITGNDAILNNLKGVDYQAALRLKPAPTILA
ncbi:MAG: hypothetical protein SWN10_15905 [Pseudomonadota bacterium]|jgi:hypothetical protein|uniref:Uncharacterized protein n=1 Tax=Alteromonas alba TaxID=2079529 RepID=A0A2S9VA50_9ALTE|nr:hypothetical protein [Alteromonas alba]MAJ70311.1 hypothetical protein [Alteromonadaceae bacterium]MCP4864794.1 hypothetical protein [Alteromonas sp.]MDY6928573.1 hypothetical protein [Pseudomonadota bacterium]RPH12853.1 MAG: hypothetical protein CBB67_022085 [Alteromonadaceae bacterium TMED7]PRO73326.1 hypothetical protein C6Y40_11960 [Alteromonas alba]|tara:strand:+ start:5868 stop:6176 length:309 start_codon:yes stop_codon:yes gene_type:complete